RRDDDHVHVPRRDRARAGDRSGRAGRETKRARRRGARGDADDLWLPDARHPQSPRADAAERARRGGRPRRRRRRLSCDRGAGMTLSFDLFWSFRSPYSYLATPRLVEMERDYDLSIAVRPVYPLAVRSGDFFEKQNPLWIPYLMRDTYRLSQML